MPSQLGLALVDILFQIGRPRRRIYQHLAHLFYFVLQSIQRVLSDR